MPDEPVRSRSSVYFERYAGAEHQAKVLRYVVYALAAACLILTATLMITVTRPKAIHYVPAVSASGFSMPGIVPSSSAVSFASAWLMNWLNYSPRTAAGVYERSLVFMAPAFQAQVKAGLDEELAKIARDKLASVFTLKEDPAVIENAAGFRVSFVGERGIYVGQEEMSREQLRFMVDVRRAYPTEINPYGLVIADVIKERISGAAF